MAARRLNLPNATGRALIVGLIVYVAMRFVIPHSMDRDVRSLLAAAVAFVASWVVGLIGTPRGFWRW